MRAFVTVGSTTFDLLVDAILQPNALKALRNKGYTELVIQCGDTKLESLRKRLPEYHHFAEGLDIYAWKYKESLEKFFKESELILSHAGSLFRESKCTYVQMLQALAPSSKPYAAGSHSS